MATLIRAYADRAQAQRLHDELLDAGLAPDRVRLLHGEQGDGSMRSPAVQDEGRVPGDRGVLSSLGHFFASALGGDGPDTDGGRYTQALQRGETVLAVSTQSPAEDRLVQSVLEGPGRGAGSA